MNLFEKIRKVDISLPLEMIPKSTFLDTGGTNGWLCHGLWLQQFADTLQLPGNVTHVVCRKLPAWQGIPPHVDRCGPYDRRYHVPIITHPDIRMRWPEEDVEVHLEQGFLYEVCFSMMHEIVHHAPIDRVHVQIDTVHYYKN